MVLNMLSTAAMIRLGKSYGNLMVDVRVSNEKLAVRANRILSQVCGVTLQEAQAVLARCDAEVKTAIVMLKAGLDVDQARQRLARARGFVRRALEIKS
jgi:N-acetylmuramic acid 6-phosphate etherase